MNRRLPHFCSFTLLTVAVVATSSSAVHGATPDRASFGTAWQTVDCKTFDLPAAIAAQTDCGYVTVPEQHAQPQGRTIQLAVVRARSTSKAPAADPLFVEQGGPGDSTIGVIVDKALLAFSELPALLKSRDLIFVEERGTRYSKPFLSCPELDAHNIAVAKGEKDYTDPSWFKVCNDRFKQQGINPNAFNTLENAADVYFVAETLGYPQFNYYGVSYGTLLGQYVIAQADKHKAKLRSVILDGVVRPDIDFNLASGHTFSYALRNLFHACAQDQQCSSAYPNLEQKFLAIINQLNQKPVPLTLTIPSSKKTFVTQLDGNAFLIGLEAYLARPYSGESAHGTSIPKFIQAASQGNFGWIAEKLSENLESSNDSAKGMYHTVLCARAKSIQVTPSQVLPPPYPQLIPVGIREGEAVTKVCDVLQAELKPPFVYENPEVPTLVLNGAYDPVTPQPYGEAVARNLKTAYVYTFPGVGHGSLFAPKGMPAGVCVTQIADSFLANPKQTPDSSCLTQIKPAFVIE
ncbi:alpha/beta hydrolase [Kovacikia minuta CCNUW1]|uniref:alpha/beta fold hydrolase n=1 Tax=Kovacikia minuta TaxID=2931930 RepID=UPI001CCD4EF1|nr:alpha/beta fold hydrolase [Kovacikia minuta]UBF26230.1 alpha/beta hydrolase [Kovacikia minuta CCNUW1]